MDLMHALGMVYATEGARKLVRLKYLGEDDLRREIERVHLLDEVTKIPEVNQWRIDKPGTLTGLIHLAVEEYLAREVCAWCNGQQSRMIESKHEVCGLCKGLGMHKISERTRAKIAGIEQSRWERTWGQRYSTVRAYVFDSAEGVIARMDARLKAHHGMDAA
jgi:hypothetical protein